MLSRRHLPVCPSATRPGSGAAAALTTICAALSGCAVGSVGTLVANVERRDTASVLSVYSVGLHLRTRPDDPGAHIGYSKRTYVFIADGTLAPGWYFLSVPSPARSALAQDLTTIGVDLSPAAPTAGLSLGYVHTRLLARVPWNACVLIEYFGSEMRINKLQTCEENTCAMHELPR